MSHYELRLFVGNHKQNFMLIIINLKKVDKKYSKFNTTIWKTKEKQRLLLSFNLIKLKNDLIN